MGAYVSAPRIDFDAAKISESVLRGLGGPETMEAVRTAVKQFTGNADQITFALIHDVHLVAMSVTVLMAVLAAYVMVLILRSLRRPSSPAPTIILLVAQGQSSWVLVRPQVENSESKDRTAQLVVGLGDRPKSSGIALTF
ncbi:hypothetical protein B0H19DRAFT_1079262 [Mycena capillaripes]|nr:hypothetical protein B0H19DRAFT_1079262 [Mycena capillaripes]